MKSPEEKPRAPAASASSRRLAICCSSSAVAARRAMPTVMRRSVLWPTCGTTFTAVAG
ncbi:MAG: hypothetical protein IPJ28_15590 [Betaproteobacteria bacterium]|nr:hypothetical protein [Betaproteobacteria bacterium]